MIYPIPYILLQLVLLDWFFLLSVTLRYLRKYICKKWYKEILGMLCLVSYNDNILQNCGMLSHAGYWGWYRCKENIYIPAGVHVSPVYSHRNLPSLAPGNCSSLSIILSFKEYYITGIIECVTLWNWLFFSTQHNSLEIHPGCWSGCISVVHSFLLLSNKAHHRRWNHSPAEVHLGWGCS